MRSAPVREWMSSQIGQDGGRPYDCLLIVDVNLATPPQPKKGRVQGRGVRVGYRINLVLSC